MADVKISAIARSICYYMKETINVILICGISEVNITLEKHPRIHTSDESEADLLCLYVDVNIRRREGCARDIRCT